VEDSLSRLEPLGVKIYTSNALTSVDGGEITVRKEDGEEKIACDAVVLAVGVRPEKSLLDEMQNITVNTFVAGDADKGGSIGKANHNAYKAAMRIK
jgi:2-enoate reductase